MMKYWLLALSLPALLLAACQPEKPRRVVQVRPPAPHELVEGGLRYSLFRREALRQEGAASDGLHFVLQIEPAAAGQGLKAFLEGQAPGQSEALLQKLYFLDRTAFTLARGKTAFPCRMVHVEPLVFSRVGLRANLYFDRDGQPPGEKYQGARLCYDGQPLSPKPLCFSTWLKVAANPISELN